MTRLMACACAEQKGGGLQQSDLLVKQITLDQRRPEPHLQSIALQFFTAARPVRQGSFPTSEEGVVPAGERRRRHAQRARRSPGLPRATAEAPLQSCAVGTSCHRGRAPLRQTLAVAPRHPAALQRRSLDCPWHTPRAEIVRLRGVPINRDAEEPSCTQTTGTSLQPEDWIWQTILN